LADLANFTAQGIEAERPVAERSNNQHRPLRGRRCRRVAFFRLSAC
jgi:hypothetical protein